MINIVKIFENNSQILIQKLLLQFIHSNEYSLQKINGMSKVGLSNSTNSLLNSMTGVLAVQDS